MIVLSDEEVADLGFTFDLVSVGTGHVASESSVDKSVLLATVNKMGETRGIYLFYFLFLHQVCFTYIKGMSNMDCIVGFSSN